MKIFYARRFLGRNFRGLTMQCILMVKTIALLLWIGLMTVHAEGYSQRVNLNLKTGSLTEFLTEIENQSDYIFFYKDNLVSNRKVENLIIKDQELLNVLTKVLDRQNLNYEISGRQITLKAKKKVVQNREIRGTVRDGQGVPLSEVNVLVKGTNIGATTDNEGRYRLEISNDVTLIFSLVGYKDLEVGTKERIRIDAVLELDSRDLDEVVVTGYNRIEKRHVASAVSEMNMDLATNRPIAKLQEAFSGTIPGVTMVQGSNIPGGVPGSIAIRGVSTLQEASPLVIVDGMEQSLTDIDPNQIKSINVLKDAASASLYGSRGANGVIIIETKRGSTGQFKVDLHSWTAFSEPIDLPNFVNARDYMRLNNEAREIQGQTPLFDANQIAQADRGEFNEVNWLNEIMERRAHSHNTTANISGGGGVGAFNLMLGYLTENGMNNAEGSEKFSARFNTNINIADKFVLMADFYAHRLQVDRLMTNTNGHGLYHDAWKMNPTQQIFYESERPDHYILHNNINPIASINYGGMRNNVHDRSTINLRPRYFISNGLSIDGNVSYMINKSAWKEVRRPFMFYDGNGRPALNWTNTVGADQGVSESQLTARANVNYEKDLRSNKDKLYLIAGSEIMNHTFTDYREINKASFFGKANYSLANRYILEFTARADGSSKFAPGHRWGFFPSGAIAWNAHDEAFLAGLRDRNIINNLKVRVSYGLVGNENVPPYLWQEVVNNWGWTIRVPNPEFSWEKQRQGNIGLDVSLLKNRLNFTGEIYHKFSYDLIYSRFPVPPLTGSNNLESAINIGEVENKGFEISANWGDKIGDFSYRVGGMLFNNENRVLKAGYNQGDSLIFKDNVDQIWYRGIAIENYYGFQSNGFFQTAEDVNNTPARLPNTLPGDIRYVDQNGDGIINEQDRVNLGDPFPHMNFAINLDLSYKRWDFTMLAQGVGRRMGRLNGMEGYPVLMDGTNNNLGTPRQEYMDNRWTPETPNSRFPRVWTGQSPNAMLSDIWLSDAAFLRIKMLQLGYTFPKIGSSISNLRIYLNAQDAFTFTKWEGLDPERDGGNGGYPRMAVFSFGLRATIL